MKPIFLCLFLLPVMTFGQLKAKSKVVAKVPAAAAWDGYIIDGNAKGFPDGTKVSLVNGQTGAPETETTVQKEHFIFKGKVPNGDFKIILFNEQPPYITLYLENKPFKLLAEMNAMDKAVVSGSSTNADIANFNKQMAPYQNAFNDALPFDSAVNANALRICYDFAMQHAASLFTPIVIIHYNQLTEEPQKTEQLYTGLTADVKNTPMAAYVAQLVAESKKNALGTIMPDFSEPDTTGKLVALSSLRGKYVLVDFWASWCRPCRAENPNVVASYNRFKDRNFTVLGVSLDKAKQSWIDAINMDNLTWNHVSDLQAWSNAAAQQFQVYSIPANFLIDPTGKIIGKNLRGAALDRMLGRVLR